MVAFLEAICSAAPTNLKMVSKSRYSHPNLFPVPLREQARAEKKIRGSEKNDDKNRENLVWRQKNIS